jgi:hypothetical protein
VRLEKVLCAHVHRWAMSKDWSFSQLLAFKKHREGHISGIRFENFFDFNRIVRQEIVETIVLVATIVTVVLPKNSE